MWRVFPSYVSGEIALAARRDPKWGVKKIALCGYLSHGEKNRLLFPKHNRVEWAGKMMFRWGFSEEQENTDLSFI